MIDHGVLTISTLARKTALLLGALFCMCISSSASEISGFELSAMIAAYSYFKADQPQAQISNFTVITKTSDGNIEIVFAPLETEEEFRNGLVGGSTSYGSEIHYIFARDGLRLVSKHLAK